MVWNAAFVDNGVAAAEYQHEARRATRRSPRAGRNPCLRGAGPKMIWIVFGAMAVATFLAVSRILVEADPAHARKQIRLTATVVWAVGLALSLAGKPLYGLALMSLGAVGLFAAPRPRRPSRVSEGDRRGDASGRRPNVEGDPDPRSGEVGRGSGVMTEKQAYEVLGLQPGASAEEISRSHRTLMKKFHPDQGGSTELAARLNAAKDLLAKRRHG